MEKAKFCPALWFSGFFGLGAVVHLIRLVTGLSLVVAGREIPVSWSGVAVVIFGGLSICLFVLSLKKPCETGKSKSSDCCK